MRKQNKAKIITERERKKERGEYMPIISLSDYYLEIVKINLF